ncbi:ribosome biogenesis GTPase Der [Candidatus Falkowbacteria bacterium]|nr:ribosome biogenesis GTPase Der [Candidatus Falkowbacteria bacterium]
MLAKKLKGVLPLIALVGRANVGKSTIFNTLTDKKQALVSNTAGTTRDANIGQVEWGKRKMRLVDTGGFLDLDFLTKTNLTAKTIDESVQRQAREFITRADVVLFVVDVKEGLLPDDQKLAKILKGLLPEKTNLILVANKADSVRDRSEASNFYRLNLGDPQIISAATGSGTGDLLDEICLRLKNWRPKEELMADDNIEVSTSSGFTEEQESGRAIRVCLLGKPNVGKSSLLNALSGFERVIVSPIAHTTREPQNTELVYKNRNITIIDTAGIHKKGLKGGPSKTKENLDKKLENQGINASLRALQGADIALLVLDVSIGLSKQDAKLVEEILKRRKSLIIIANKWDLVEKRDTIKYSQDIYRTVPFAQFVPIQFISAKTKEKVNKILELICHITDNRHLELNEEQLREFICRCVNGHPPTKGKGTRYPRIRHFGQSDTNPPEFSVKVGAKEYLDESYLHYLTNRLRDSYDLVGTPVKMWVEKANTIHGKADN